MFFCNPASRTADADCGKGFMCYSSAQALGGSVCLPECDPNDATTCNGACTQSGACLTRCTVPKLATDVDPCPAPLVCARTTDSPIEAVGGNDGVCLPLNAVCASNADCTSPVFTECTATVNGSAQGMGLLTSGNVCVQGKCNGHGIAVRAGLGLRRDVLPDTIPAPDVCSPICTPVRDRKPGVAFNECLPGLTCLSDAFPQTDAPACAPGFPGWLCVDDLGCTAGELLRLGRHLRQVRRLRDLRAAVQDRRRLRAVRPRRQSQLPLAQYLPRRLCRRIQQPLLPDDLPQRAATTASSIPSRVRLPVGGHGHGADDGAGRVRRRAAVCVHGCSSPSDCDTLAAARCTCR